MSQSNKPVEMLADRLNSEPPIILGLTNSEVGMVVKVSALVFIPTCTIIGFLLGATTIGIAAAAILVVGSIPVSGKILQAVKRGRPDYYYQHKIALRGKTNTDGNDYIVYTGGWELGRTEDDR